MKASNLDFNLDLKDKDSIFLSEDQYRKDEASCIQL